ncbi:MAG: UDP-N-acetylmuramoyl-L-alanine--D-glutamate ligase [Deltaproteobacteria bacterium]|nr:UDP-N-acetylmuramoyl-L-alanine--D-glutamate ligase [Deltaproteobacteria bacterium]
MVKKKDDSRLAGLREPIGILGVGVEGRATIDYLLREGICDITALDRREIGDLPAGVKSVFGADHDQDLEKFATIFRSPGIRPDHPSLTAARSAGCLVTSAVSHFLEQCPALTIGVTGTVGKGTAASLVARMLEQDGRTVHLGGNIGSSPLEFLRDVNPEHVVVLEISSFQAMDVTSSPGIGVILKTTSEHLDWHVDLDEYLDAKANLLAAQGTKDTVVYNADASPSVRIADSGSTRRLAYSLTSEVEEGIYCNGGRFILRLDGRESTLPLDLDQVRLPGFFNLENVAAAILAAHAAGGSTEAICLAGVQFEGLPHRLELAAEAGAIRFYNDSYATRPEAALGALSCFDDVPLAIILGGSEKYADFSVLAKALVEHPKIVEIGLIGETAGRLKRAIDKAGQYRFDVIEYEDLEPAMDGAVRALSGSGVVLLAPACASFGLFPNYKVRGERFRAKAALLARELNSSG